MIHRFSLRDTSEGTREVGPSPYELELWTKIPTSACQLVDLGKLIVHKARGHRLAILGAVLFAYERRPANDVTLALVGEDSADAIPSTCNGRRICSGSKCE